MEQIITGQAQRHHVRFTVSWEGLTGFGAVEVTRSFGGYGDDASEISVGGIGSHGSEFARKRAAAYAKAADVADVFDNVYDGDPVEAFVKTAQAFGVAVEIHEVVDGERSERYAITERDA